MEEKNKVDKNKVEKFCENVTLVFDIICSVIFFVSFVYNLFKGIATHDVYYLVMSIIDYGFLKVNTKSITKTLDIEI